MKKEQISSIELFLIELEKWILKQENGIESIKRRKKERKYIKDLLEVLKTSKVGFAKEVYTATKEKQEEFLEIMKKVISNDQQYHQTINQIANLYFLKKEGLIHEEAARPQKEEAEKALNMFIKKCEEYLETVVDKKDEQRLDNLYRFMESLFSIATKFDGNELIEEIEDIDFFQEVLNLMNIPPQTKLDVIAYVFNQSNALHHKEESTERKTSSYGELKKFYQEEDIENTEELLDEILNDDTNRRKL